MKILFTLIITSMILSCTCKSENKTGDFYRKCVIEKITEIKSDSLSSDYVVETDCGKSIIKTTGNYRYKNGDTIIIRD